MTTPNPRTPVLVSALLVFGGLILASLNGLATGSIIGGIVAGTGVIPAAYGAWRGMQQQTQAPLAGAISMMLVSVGVGTVLLILALVHKIGE